jgi:cytochrome oxidase assembly protein ShyY1
MTTITTTLSYTQVAILLWATNQIAVALQALVVRWYGTWQRNRLARQYGRIKQKETAARQRSLEAAQRRTAAAQASMTATYDMLNPPQPPTPVARGQE